MSQLFVWGGQSTGVSALASFLPKKSKGWSHSEWTGWMSLKSKELSRVFSSTTVWKHQFFGAQPSLWSSSHIKHMSVQRPIGECLSPVQSLSCVWLFMTPWTAAPQASLSITNSQSPPNDSCPLSQWCHPTISSSVVRFSSCPPSFPASRSFLF